MKKLAVLFTILALPAYAEQSSTESANISGIKNCLFVSTTVTRGVNSIETRTWLQTTIRVCPTGGTQPTQTVLSVSQLIPDADFKLDQRGITLITKIPDGVVNIQWTVTKSQHNTYSADWVWDTDGQATIRENQKTDTRSATVKGTIGNYVVDGFNGYVMVGSGVTR